MAFWEAPEFGIDGEEDKQSAYTGKSNFVFLIDCTRPMFETDSGGSMCPLQLGIKCAETFMRKKCVTNSTDYVGVVFCGTTKGSDEYGIENACIFQGLTQPGVNDVLKLQKLQNNLQTSIDAQFGISNSYITHNALWLCVQMLDSSSAKFGKKEIFFLTGTDNPHSDNVDVRNVLRKRIADFQEKVDIDILPTVPNFNFSKFYQSALNLTKAGRIGSSSPDDILDEVLSAVHLKEFNKRSFGNVKWSLGPELQLSVNLYNIIAPTRIPTAERIDRRSNTTLKPHVEVIQRGSGEEVTTVSDLNEQSYDEQKIHGEPSCGDFGSYRPLVKEELRKYVDYGGERIVLEAEEVVQLKDFGESRIELIGFKPSGNLSCKPHHFVRPAMFVYPDDTWVKGSKKLFTGLLNRCLAKKVMAICLMIPRKHSLPRLVAMIPQAEEVDKDGSQIIPPGFNAIFLPFADDLRKPPAQCLCESDGDAVINQKAKSLISKMKMQYKPEMFENPVLQKYYTCLEALALDTTEEPFLDKTKPDTDQLSKRAGKELDEFARSVYPDGKQIKVSKKKVPENAADINLEACAKNGSLGRFTVPALRAAAANAGIHLKCTRKADIVSAISKHFGV